MDEQTDPRVADALEELQRFLAGNLAPALFADSLGILIEAGAEPTAAALHAWVGPDGAASALTRLAEVAELELLPEAPLADFLASVARRVGAAAPTLRRPDRAVPPSTAAPASATVPDARPAAAEPTSFQDSPRFRQLLGRWEEARSGSATPAPDLGRLLLVLAAAEASSAAELESRLARLQAAGIGPAVARDFVRSLSESVGDWALRDGDAISVDGGLAAEAIRRVVRHAGDRARATARWKELLVVATENLGRAWGRAATLLEIAEAAARDGEVDARSVEQARASAHEWLDAGALLEAASDPMRRAVLGRFCRYLPGWSVPTLLDELRFEEDKKRRRHVLGLIETWGLEAREIVFDRLVAAGAGTDPDIGAWWYVRNLVSLLHRLPRAEGDDGRRELEVAATYCRIDAHPVLQREVFTLLGQLPRGAGAPVLIERLREAERALDGPSPPLEPPEASKVLGTLAAALVRSEAPAARRALFEHGLGDGPRAAEAVARWRELGRADLSDDPELVDRMLAELRSHLPVKVLGVLVARGEAVLEHLIKALWATRAAAVRETLADVARRFGDRPFGRLAAEAIAAPAPTAQGPGAEGTRPATLRASATADGFQRELAAMLQELERCGASGRLTLRDPGGPERATLDLVRGAVEECRSGRLAGEAAFFSLFEHPAAAAMDFSPRQAASGSSATPSAVTHRLREARRRCEELDLARALVPDDARFGAGAGRPSAPLGEADGELMRRLWTGIRSGASAAECEVDSGVETLRTRRILAHWLVEDAVRLAPRRPPSPSA